MTRGGWSERTFGEAVGVAVHLQGVEGADLQLGVVVQELLHDGFEGQQQRLLLLQLLLGGGRQLLVALGHAQLLGNVLQEAEVRGGKKGFGSRCERQIGFFFGGWLTAVSLTE